MKILRDQLELKDEKQTQEVSFPAYMVRPCDLWNTARPAAREVNPQILTVSELLPTYEMRSIKRH